jgi:hypothetical protein
MGALQQGVRKGITHLFCPWGTDVVQSPSIHVIFNGLHPFLLSYRDFFHWRRIAIFVSNILNIFIIFKPLNIFWKYLEKIKEVIGSMVHFLLCTITCYLTS